MRYLKRKSLKRQRRGFIRHCHSVPTILGGTRRTA